MTMCVVCLEFNKGKLTVREAQKALWELVNDKDQDVNHIQDLYSQLEKKLDEEKKGLKNASDKV